VAKLNPAGSALVYSTYLGGTDNENGQGIAVDGAGSAYVTGDTGSSGSPGGFPTQNAFQPTMGGGLTDAFLAKLSPQGNALVYSTYIGGTDNDFGSEVALDSQGSAFVTGKTASFSGFPTQNALQPNHAPSGLLDAFVTKFNPAGSALVYSTYVGGKGDDVGNGIAVDAQGSAYVTGTTVSSQSVGAFPTQNPLQADNAGGEDAFVAKLNAAGSALVYSTYLGGTGSDEGSGIALDAQNNAYLTGITNSSGAGAFPTTQNAIQGTKGGDRDAFVAKINAQGSALTYSTYLGGFQNDFGLGIAVDAQGNAYVGGRTTSSNSSGGFPTKNPLQADNAGSDDAFVAKLNAQGNGLVYSTYLGGTSTESGNAIALDCAGNAYIIGDTLSSGSGGFPTKNPIQPNYAGSGDAFVTKISDSATAPQPPCAAAGPHSGHGGHGALGSGGGQAPLVGTGADGGDGGRCGGGGTGGGGLDSNGGGGGGGCFSVAGVQGLAGGTVTATAGVATNNSSVHAEVFAKLARKPRTLIGRKTMTRLRVGRHKVVIRLSARARRAFKRLRRVKVSVRLRMTAPSGRPLIVTRTVTLKR
jgi:hypothetical protein